VDKLQAVRKKPFLLDHVISAPLLDSCEATRQGLFLVLEAHRAVKKVVVAGVWTAPFEPPLKHLPRGVAKMSDFGGLGGALMLGQQLEIYRWEDHRRRAREGNALASNDAAWRNQYGNLVSQYNRLLNDASRLADVHDRERALKDAQIAELVAANKSHESKAEATAVDLAYAKATVKLLRGLVKELRPDLYHDDGQDD
jgi:hypothetical protein